MTTKAIWMTDIHLNFLGEDAARWEAFYDELAYADGDCFLISGDIGEADSVVDYLTRLVDRLEKPIYFVLGNHDYYHGSIREVREAVAELSAGSPSLVWLSVSGPVRLGAKTGLVGHDGWGDGRLGNYANTPVDLNDFYLIEELAGLSHEDLLEKIEILGDEAARHLRRQLDQAIGVYDHLVVLTHVPPFAESCWSDGRPGDPDWLPYFSCQAVGAVLRETMAARPEKQMTVFCGHTHGAGQVEILSNLTVHTGAAKYYKPTVQGVWEFE